MLELTLIRHAKSGPAEHGRADFDRTLNARGQQDASRMGERLSELPLCFDLMLSSSAQRAIETARLIAKGIGFSASGIQEIGAFYNADADMLLAEVQRTDPSYRHIALVGHNPGISWLYRLLTGESADMPTCAVAVIHFDVSDWQAVHTDTGWVVHYEYPKKLSGG